MRAFPFPRDLGGNVRWRRNKWGSGQGGGRVSEFFADGGICQMGEMNAECSAACGDFELGWKSSIDK